MASESTAHSAFGVMGYWLTAHLGSRNYLLISLDFSILYKFTENIGLPVIYCFENLDQLPAI